MDDLMADRNIARVAASFACEACKECKMQHSYSYDVVSTGLAALSRRCYSACCSSSCTSVCVPWSASDSTCPLTADM